RAEERFREQLDALTTREEEILKLLATGESNREIGKRLFISEQTVKNHVASIFRKLQVNDRTKAALLAGKLGLGRKPRPRGRRCAPRCAVSRSPRVSSWRCSACSPSGSRTGRSTSRTCCSP